MLSCAIALMLFWNASVKQVTHTTTEQSETYHAEFTGKLQAHEFLEAIRSDGSSTVWKLEAGKTSFDWVEPLGITVKSVVFHQRETPVKNNPQAGSVKSPGRTAK